MTYTAVGCGVLAAGVGMALARLYRKTVDLTEQIITGIGS